MPKFDKFLRKFRSEKTGQYVYDVFLKRFRMGSHNNVVNYDPILRSMTSKTGSVVHENLSSFVWHSEDYYLRSDTLTTSGMTSGYTMHMVINIGTESTGDFLTLVNAWDNAGTDRGIIFRLTDGRKVEYLSSEFGTGLDIRLITTATYNSNGVYLFSIVHDTTALTATDAVKFYVNGVLQTWDIPLTDTGNYGIYGSSDFLQLGAQLNASSPLRYFRGWMNQFAITSDIQDATQILGVYNSGNIKDFSTIDNLLTDVDFDVATFSSGYTIPDSASANQYVQTGAAPSLRTSSKNDFLNPYGISFDVSVYPLDGSEFYYFDDEVSAVIGFSDGINISLSHIGVTDPDRNSCEVLSGGSYYVGDGTPLWVRFNNYDWDTSIDEMSHGGFSIIDDRNDLTYAAITHRVIAPDLDKLGNYRVVGAIEGNQTGLEYVSGVPKGKDVFIKYEAGTVTYWYNNSGTLTQIGGDYAIDMGDWVRIKAHARDSSNYAAPDVYSASGLRVYRGTPIDL